jgi:hypothetical protein
MKKEDVMLVLGVLVIVIGVVMMVEGSILGERTSEVAAALGIVGILIVGFASRLRRGKGLF